MVVGVEMDSCLDEPIASTETHLDQSRRAMNCEPSHNRAKTVSNRDEDYCNAFRAPDVQGMDHMTLPVEEKPCHTRPSP